jgi:ubiquinone/menaquinone biosynthesis C-methylase UbiE
MSVPEHENDYDTLAPAYATHADNNADNAHYERPAALALIGNTEGLRILDAGCGPGNHATALLAGGAVEASTVPLRHSARLLTVPTALPARGPPCGRMPT